MNYVDLSNADAEDVPYTQEDVPFTQDGDIEVDVGVVNGQSEDSGVHYDYEQSEEGEDEGEGEVEEDEEDWMDDLVLGIKIIPPIFFPLFF